MHASGTEVWRIRTWLDSQEDPGPFPEHWCNREWTSLVPFNAGRALETIPDKPGPSRLAGQGPMMYVLPAQSLTGTE